MQGVHHTLVQTERREAEVEGGDGEDDREAEDGKRVDRRIPSVMSCAQIVHVVGPQPMSVHGMN